MARFNTRPYDPPRHKEWLRNFSLLCLSSAVILIALEGAVRVRGYLRYRTWSYLADDLYTKNPQTGVREIKTNHSLGEIQINSLGFRGLEPIVPKPALSIRLAFLGASTTFCQELGREETTWPYLVWAGLQNKFPQLTIDYVNAAIPGFRTYHSLNNLKEKVGPLEPDVIVIYHSTNDLAEITRRVAKESGISTLSLDTPGPISHISMLWYLAEKNFRLWRLKSQAATGDPNFKASPQDYAIEFEKNLRELVGTSKKYAKVVALATFSYRLRRDQSESEKMAAAESAQIYMPYLGIDRVMEGYEAFNMVIRKVARETGVELISNEFSIPGDAEHFLDTVHFTKAGSEAMASRVLSGLLESTNFQAFIYERISAVSKELPSETPELEAESNPSDSDETP